MIDRKKYLELCQKNAAGIGGIFVEYSGGKYIPVSLSIWFNEMGECQNTAVLCDLNFKSTINCRLQEISCLDK